MTIKSFSCTYPLWNWPVPFTHQELNIVLSFTQSFITGFLRRSCLFPIFVSTRRSCLIRFLRSIQTGILNDDVGRTGYRDFGRIVKLVVAAFLLGVLLR